MQHITIKNNIIKNGSILLLITVIFSLFLSGCSSLESNDKINSVLGSLGIVVNEQTPETNEAFEPTVTGPAETNIPAEEQTPTPEPTPASYAIQLWVPPQFDTSQDTQAGKALSAAISAYTTENPNVTISLRVKAVSGDSSMVNTIVAADHVAKDVLPSLALMSRSDMESAVQRGMLQPITTNIFSDSGSWYNYARQSAVVESTVYGIPILGDGLALTYRTAKIGAELGDWQDILGRGLPIGFAPSSSTSLFGAFMYLSLGGKLTNDQGQPYLDQQKLTDTLNFFLSGGQNGSFPPSIAQLVDQSQVWQRFSDGTMSIIVSPFSSFRHYKTPEISVRSLPLQPGSTDYPLINTWNLVLLEDNPILQEEALKFAYYLSDSTENDTLSVSAGYLPVRNNAHEAWQNDEQLDVMKMMCENAVLVPNNSVAAKIYPIINNAISQVIKNQTTPEDAAKEAVSTLN